MKNNVCKSPLIFLSAILMCTAFQTEFHAQKAKPDEIVSFVHAYDKAWNSKDISAVDRMLATNYIYFSSTGSTTSRKRTMEFLRSPGYILKSAVRSELVVYRTN